MWAKPTASVLLIACLLALPVHAQCTKSRALHTSSHRSAQIWFGKITVLSKFLQPSGTLLASAVVPPTAFPGSDSTGASANTILWTCEASALPQLHFLVATNGQERLNGHNDVGAADGLSNLYATWFNCIGLRLTMDGIWRVRRYRPLSAYGSNAMTTPVPARNTPVRSAWVSRCRPVPGRPLKRWAWSHRAVVCKHWSLTSTGKTTRWRRVWASHCTPRAAHADCLSARQTAETGGIRCSKAHAESALRRPTIRCTSMTLKLSCGSCRGRRSRQVASTPRRWC